MHIRTADIVVIGGGPAGGVAAKKLSDDGFSVILFEKERIPRHKHCAGFISHKSVMLLRSIGIDCEKILSGINSFTLVCGNDSYKMTPCVNNIAQGNIYREEFDTLLIKSAEENGVRVIDNARVMDIKKN